MPQPMSRVFPRGRENYSPTAALEYPHLVSYVHTVLQAWATADAHLTGQAAHFLKADFKTVIAMMDALKSADAKRAAQKAAARAGLNDDEFLLYEAILKATKPSRDRRNEFAHHLWGVSADVPNALLLAPPEKIISTQANAARFDAFTKTKNTQHLDTTFSHGEAMVYRETDLRQSAEEAEQAVYVIVMFTHLLRSDVIYRATLIREQIRLQICNNPQVRQALDTLSRRRATRSQTTA